ncbi:MAG: GNAT family N-acetyltransferase [Tenericutes bacterium]|nr:GNAT family N-acetyltransferase [Mycoplasmatota bacterium]
MKFLKNKKILEMSEANPSDAEKILEYCKKVGSESTNLVMDGSGIGLSVEEETKYLEKNKASLNNKTFIAKVDGEIVSVFGLNGSSREKIKHNVSLGISVLKDYWNIGIGTHCMQYALNYCRMTLEIENVNLEVRADNDIAIKMYKKLGFKEVGKYTKKFKIEGKYFDSLVMELVLRMSN